MPVSAAAPVLLTLVLAGLEIQSEEPITISSVCTVLTWHFEGWTEMTPTGVFEIERALVSDFHSAGGTASVSISSIAIVTCLSTTNNPVPANVDYRVISRAKTQITALSCQRKSISLCLKYTRVTLRSRFKLAAVAHI